MNFADKTLLISGIGGFIGLRAAEIAIAKGLKVRGLEKDAELAQNAEKLGVEIISGSVTDSSITQRACQDVDIVIHTEEVAKEGGSIKEFSRVNIDGTINIGKAARNAGVKDFVHLSTASVYGFDYPNNVTEKETLVKEKNPYCQTKIEAEKALQQLNSARDFGIIIIRAGDVYGPGSIPWTVRPISFMQQKLFAYTNEGKVINHLYVDNLIDAIFLAIEKEQHGEIFNITDGKETSPQEFFTRLAEVADCSAPSSLGKEEIRVFLKLRCQGQKLLRKKPDIYPEAVDFMSRPYTFSIEKARRILGYQPAISLDEGMARIKAWLKNQN
ncbi:nucleoside-diphosphate-sugar epimerase [Rivularia sp. PCC 7116]|uniref:NAD-dependent epimerase/dehydratase family protein n=1 Tax=Rivularia sp. PCC 7116 TaxID=373994 RepID=UPI00029EF112|nr:NAD(P)-dependent oxidoreductase [Rivularia sp. PCC 7116]AFY54728.1 nucleoside-diphosphate-sugar epimerase [Rivularia sp. PCC 7116]